MTFRAKYLNPEMSCFAERAGVFADLFFRQPYRKDGLSYGFTVPQWSIDARRMNNSAIAGEAAPS